MISLHVVLAVCALVSFLLAAFNVPKLNWTALGFFFAFAWVVVR